VKPNFTSVRLKPPYSSEVNSPDNITDNQDQISSFVLILSSFLSFFFSLTRNTYRILVVKPQWKKQFLEPSSDCKNSFNIDHTEIMYEDVIWAELV
jgi:hypothetical protein